MFHAWNRIAVRHTGALPYRRGRLRAGLFRPGTPTLCVAMQRGCPDRDPVVPQFYDNTAGNSESASSLYSREIHRVPPWRALGFVMTALRH